MPTIKSGKKILQGDIILNNHDSQVIASAKNVQLVNAHAAFITLITMIYRFTLILIGYYMFWR